MSFLCLHFQPLFNYNQTILSPYTKIDNNNNNNNNEPYPPQLASTVIFDKPYHITIQSFEFVPLSLLAIWGGSRGYLEGGE